MLYTAFLVDQLIFEWGEQVKQMMSFDVELTQDILKQIQENLRDRMHELKLHEYFLLSQQVFVEMLQAVPPRKPSQNIFAKDPIDSIQDFLQQSSSTPTNKPRGIVINLEIWKQLNIAYEQSDLKIAIQTYNQNWEKKLKSQWIPEIVSNTISDVRRNFFQTSYRKFDDPWPIVTKYFSLVHGKQKFYALNNGWVSNADSRQLFVTSRQYYYLRRRVNAWGDLMRIRYGECPSDSPAAWNHMLEYVQYMAKYFDGFRMDNLHGTPIHVARYLTKQARKVNPDLIVFAELFTGSEAQTATFVRQIGINSTLKQAQYMLSGESFVRSFHQIVEKTKPYLGSTTRIFYENGEKIKYSTRKKPIALVYDLTHDNQTYIQKKVHILQTPIAVTLSLMGTFIGSTKGFDQFYSKKIGVTDLSQLYAQDTHLLPIADRANAYAHLIVYKGKVAPIIRGSWDQWKGSSQLNYQSQNQTYHITLYLPPGVYQFKFQSKADLTWFLEEGRPVNKSQNHQFQIKFIDKPTYLCRDLSFLRKRMFELAEKYFHFRQYHCYHVGNIVIIFRQPENHLRGVCVIANLSTKEETLNQDICMLGLIQQSDVWVQSELTVYEGLTTQGEVLYHNNIQEYFQVGIDSKTNWHNLKAFSLPPGFACVVEFKKDQEKAQQISAIEQILTRDINLPSLGVLDINALLFGCSGQQEEIFGQTNYVVPQDSYKKLVYAGFSGVYNTIVRAKRYNNLNEGLFDNLREGNWLLDYYITRAKRHSHLKQLVEYFQKVFFVLSKLPRYLIPRYFTDFIYKLMICIESQQKGETDFERKLYVATAQFINYFPQCHLQHKVLVSAGLPHFATDWARCWGRDTFTSYVLLAQHPNIFRETILQFASAFRHGFIPNLLDQGRRPRYNSRDACWWFIRAVAQYIRVTNDYDILQSKVELIFLSSDSSQHQRLKGKGAKKVLGLEQVIQNIFQFHANGISFRQWNAGLQIDPFMTSEGFNIDIDIDPQTGFIVGGNVYNCLTWMDKMGSSTHAGTKGIPSTSRAGAPVELAGLLYSCLKSFDQFYKKGKYSFGQVQINGKKYGYSLWMQKLKQNFDTWYYVPEKLDSSDNYLRGIYRDLVASPLKYDEERFRPNALVAMAEAPELFNPDNALQYLQKVQKYLIKPKSIGVSTLAEYHTQYAPYYDNNDDSNVTKVAHGYSYHNGPEWVWLYGFYIVAKINFDPEHMNRSTGMCLLQQHLKYLLTDEWGSLPQLTNRNAQVNWFSCNSQAWSISSILMAIRHIKDLKN